MSADNWRQCPRCRAGLLKAADEAKDAESNAYGTVAIDEFDRLREATSKAMQRVVDFDSGRPPATFREDYEFYGIDEGMVCASYSGSCRTCGLSVKFEHCHEFEIGDPS